MTRTESRPAQVDRHEQVLNADGGRWVVTGPLTINNVARVLAASVAAPLPASGKVDLQGVDPVDSAGVAILLEWKRRAAAERKSLAFENVPPSMASLAELYGVNLLLSGT
ncbi:MAG: STAS domain-containing protein [Casimicrobiaceae bacterium]